MGAARRWLSWGQGGVQLVPPEVVHGRRPGAAAPDADRARAPHRAAPRRDTCRRGAPGAGTQHDARAARGPVQPALGALHPQARGGARTARQVVPLVPREQVQRALTRLAGPCRCAEREPSATPVSSCPRAVSPDALGPYANCTPTPCGQSRPAAPAVCRWLGRDLSRLPTGEFRAVAPATPALHAQRTRARGASSATCASRPGAAGRPGVPPTLGQRWSARQGSVVDALPGPSRGGVSPWGEFPRRMVLRTSWGRVRLLLGRPASCDARGSTARTAGRADERSPRKRARPGPRDCLGLRSAGA